MQNGRRATQNLMVFSQSGTANRLSNDQFSVLEKYLAPMDFGFRISIVANEPNRTGQAPQPRFYPRTWLAGRRLERQKPRQTLQATALVYEAYMRVNKTTLFFMLVLFVILLCVAVANMRYCGRDREDCRKIRKKPVFCVAARHRLNRITYCGQFPIQTEELSKPNSFQTALGTPKLDVSPFFAVTYAS